MAQLPHKQNQAQEAENARHPQGGKKVVKSAFVQMSEQPNTPGRKCLKAPLSTFEKHKCWEHKRKHHLSLQITHCIHP